MYARVRYMCVCVVGSCDWNVCVCWVAVIGMVCVCVADVCRTVCVTVCSCCVFLCVCVHIVSV